MILRILVVWYRLAPFLVAFLRDRRRWILVGPPRFLTDEVHRERARRLTRTIASLGPSFIKLAQVLGIRADIIPHIYVEELANLHDRVPPFPTSEVRKRIQVELKRPLESVFESFQGEPLAAASLGQVHRARYNGEDVIVKVLRPGVEELVAMRGFWALVVIFILGGTAYKHRRALRTQLQIWRVRQGRGAVNEDVVEQMFYRAARLAERQTLQRRPAETWREWIFGLPDPNRRSILRRALEIFEKSKYGRMPVSAADFVLLENTIRELKQPGRD